MTVDSSLYQETLRAAKVALESGDRLNTRRLAGQAARIDPGREEPWLLLAVVAAPRASIHYLSRALEINPESQRAQQGMRWAIDRLSAQENPGVIPDQPHKLVTDPIASSELVKRRPAVLLYGVIVLVMLFILLIGFNFPGISSQLVDNNPISIAQAAFEKNTRTATASPTVTPSATPVPSSSPTLTLIPSVTSTPEPTLPPTATITPPATNPPAPTFTMTPHSGKKSKKSQVKSVPPPVVNRPTIVGSDERWVYVDLSSQRAYAFQGDQLVKGFWVSTGTWQHPTVTGTFRIYVKYRATLMTGPGYYLPNVPYTMYFYKGYGLHGTYWHHNFGHPMSHGCVNFSTPDAAWLYSFASVGTVVYVSR